MIKRDWRATMILIEIVIHNKVVSRSFAKDQSEVNEALTALGFEADEEGNVWVRHAPKHLVVAYEHELRHVSELKPEDFLKN